MLRQRLHVAVLAEKVDQPRRALDVGEQERDRHGRKLGPHQPILSLPRQRSEKQQFDQPVHQPKRRPGMAGIHIASVAPANASTLTWSAERSEPPPGGLPEACQASW